jgi:hypothetical protein
MSLLLCWLHPSLKNCISSFLTFAAALHSGNTAIGVAEMSVWLGEAPALSSASTIVREGSLLSTAAYKGERPV